MSLNPYPLMQKLMRALRMRRNGNSRKRLLKTSKNAYRDSVKKQRLRWVLRVLNLCPKFSFLRGHPPEEILNTANEEGCDAIVLGTHGKGFLAHSFLGSVSKAVLHRTRKPIFVIPLPSEKTTLDWDKV